ncbi:MAG: hypothetical protein JWQ93_114 [Marmoricola sp.]|nr:hypothetical protein [Marmoricola sp.]
MNDADEGQGASGAGPQEPVGSVGEEAAKLFGALSDWARDQGPEEAGAVTGLAGSFAQAVSGVSEHIATGSEDCRYCPVCQVIHVVRQTSPEVRAHLSVAASSLLQAAAGLLATHADGAPKPSPVEKIDLDSATDWDEDR